MTAWRLEDLFSTCKESTPFTQLCWDELVSPINKRERKCSLPCSPNGHNLHVQCCCQRDAVWWEHQHIRKETKVHISGWNTAGQIQTLICLVPFDSWLHLVTATSHKVDGKKTLGSRYHQNTVFQIYKGLRMEKGLKKEKVFHLSKGVTDHESTDAF